MSFHRAICFVVLMAMVGCHRRHPVNTGPTTLASTPGVAQYINEKKGIQLSYPGNWVVHPSDDFVLLVMPPGVERDSVCSLSLDIPDLPPHLPGMIRMGMVKNGFLEDLKKQVGSLTVIEDISRPVDQAEGLRIRSTWTTDGQAHSQSALLLIHDGNVFIIRATSDVRHHAAAHGAFEEMVNSIRWR